MPSTIPFGFLSTTLHSTIGFFSQELPFSLLIAAVLTSLGLWFASMIYISSPDKIAKDSLLLARTSFDPTLKVVGKITGMVDCNWADLQTETFSGANVLLGRKYALASGLMEITYNTGAKVILQGPVTYKVESRNGGLLSVGKLTGKVESDAAKDFSVRTPTAVVTDLGTEFGVEVECSGVTHAQVFVGKVRVQRANESTRGGDASRTLVAGEFAQISGDQEILHSRDKEEFEKNSKHFTRKIQGGSYDDIYANLVLSMNPVVYYRMDRWPKSDKDASYLLVDSGPGKHHGEFHFDPTFGNCSSRGKFGAALDLHGSKSDDYAFVKDYPKTINNQLSVSAWVWPISLNYPCTAILANWFAPPSNCAQTIGQFGLGTDSDARLELAVEVRQENGKVAIARERGQRLPCAQWHHVAFVADGATLRLYRNGIQVDAVPCLGVARTSVPECLSIGCEMDVGGTRPRSDSAFVWDGRIDEVAIFNHALSTEQIRQLHKGGAVRSDRRDDR